METKSQQIWTLLQKYPLTKDELAAFSDDDIQLAKQDFAADHFRGVYKNFDRVLNDRKREKDRCDDSHKRYRDVGIGYTATIITLSIIELKYLQEVVFSSPALVFEIGGNDWTDVLKLICMTPLILCIIFSVLSQFFIFKGYLLEARGQSGFNERYFGPADKIMHSTIILFFIGTFSILWFVFPIGSLFLIGFLTLFIWHYYRWRF